MSVIIILGMFTQRYLPLYYIYVYQRVSRQVIRRHITCAKPHALEQAVVAFLASSWLHLGACWHLQTFRAAHQSNLPGTLGDSSVLLTGLPPNPG